MFERAWSFFMLKSVLRRGNSSWSDLGCIAIITVLLNEAPVLFRKVLIFCVKLCSLCEEHNVLP